MSSRKRPKILGSGLIALDVVISFDATRPVQSWAGGTCGNVLTILAYLGWDAFPIARMNGDAASERVRSDMSRWGVKLDYAACEPTADTPIVIQEIGRKKDGSATHRFTWSCPQCGEWLPSFKAIRLETVDSVVPALTGTAAFFLDRLSRATLVLAEKAAAQGAVVVFEPAGKSDDRLFQDALRLAHIVKYSDQRFQSLKPTVGSDSATILEVQTLGASGLRYRHRFGKKISGWLHLDAMKVPVADTCGSGDWCTAGLLARVASEGQRSLLAAGATGVKDALRYGQALAAWNCLFEGARGGMYVVKPSLFEKQIDDLLQGRTEAFSSHGPKRAQSAPLRCPSCPTNGNAIRFRRQAKRAPRVRRTVS